MTKVIRYGSALLIVDADNGQWVMGSGPELPTSGRNFPVPHNGAPFWDTELHRLYFWHAASQTWIHTLEHPMGAIAYFDLTGQEITISAQSDGLSNMVPVDVPVSLNADALKFDSPADGRLRFTGVRSGHAVVQCTWSTATAAPRVLVLGIAKNGAVLEASRVLNTSPAANPTGNSVRVLTPVDPGDYFELWVGNTSGNQNVTFHSLNLFAQVRFHLDDAD